MRPRWQNNGRAERPYSGKLFASLHPITDYVGGEPTHVPTLIKQGRIVVDNMIAAEYESTFPGLIPANRTFYTHIAKYPSFKGAYKHIYLDKYGLTENLYKKFKKAFQDHLPHTPGNKSVKKLLGEWLCAYNEVKLIEMAMSEAYERGGVLIYRSINGFALESGESTPFHSSASKEDRAAATEKRTSRAATSTSPDIMCFSSGGKVKLTKSLLYISTAKTFNLDGLDLWDIDVSNDGRCFFYAVVLGYLLPTLENENEFKHRCEIIFDNSCCDMLYEEMKSFDASKEWCKTHLQHLVDEKLRLKIAGVFLFLSPEDMAEIMKEIGKDDTKSACKYLQDTSTWGGNAEVRLLSILTNCILELNSTYYYPSFHQYEKDNIPEDDKANAIHILFENAHYRLGIRKDLLPAKMNDSFSEAEEFVLDINVRRKLEEEFSSSEEVGPNLGNKTTRRSIVRMVDESDSTGMELIARSPSLNNEGTYSIEKDELEEEKNKIEELLSFIESEVEEVDEFDLDSFSASESEDENDNIKQLKVKMLRFICDINKKILQIKLLINKCERKDVFRNMNLAEQRINSAPNADIAQFRDVYNPDSWIASLKTICEERLNEINDKLLCLDPEELRNILEEAEQNQYVASFKGLNLQEGNADGSESKGDDEDDSNNLRKADKIYLQRNKNSFAARIIAQKYSSIGSCAYAGVFDSRSVMLIAETDHILNHQHNIFILINQIKSGAITPNTVICLERKQYGKHLGMNSVVILAQALKLGITTHIPVDAPIYADAKLYLVAKAYGVAVLGIEGKRLSYSKESPHYNAAREEYMANSIKQIAATGKNVIFLVGSAHIYGLKERISTNEREVIDIPAERERSGSWQRFVTESRKTTGIISEVAI